MCSETASQTRPPQRSSAAARNADTQRHTFSRCRFAPRTSRPLDSTDVQAKLRIQHQSASTVGVRMSESSSHGSSDGWSRAVQMPSAGTDRPVVFSSVQSVQRAPAAAVLDSASTHRRQMRFCVCSLSVPSSVSRVSIKKQRTGVALRVIWAPSHEAQTLRSVKPPGARAPQLGVCTHDDSWASNGFNETSQQTQTACARCDTEPVDQRRSLRRQCASSRL